MELVHLPAAVASGALETLSHSALSVAHLVAHRTDAAIVFNAANAPLDRLCVWPGWPTHVDGLEWKRAKWGGLGSAITAWPNRWLCAGPMPSSPTHRASPTTTATSSARRRRCSPTGRR